MALNDQELITAYADLHRIFPEDMHIARPLIHMLQNASDIDEARNLALGMARRMLARGKSGSAIGFLEMCRNLEHPDTDEVEALASIARLTTDGPIDLEAGSSQVFTLIDQLSDHEAMDFIRQARLVSFPAGDDVVRQGEISRNFYLLLEGHMRVHLLAGSGHKVNLDTLGPGHYFGEFACVYQLPRSASVTAAETSLVLEFSDTSITELMRRSPIAGERLMDTVRSRLIHAMTHSHPAFVDIPEADRNWLAEESTLSEYQDEEGIFMEGKLANHGCIVVHGAVLARFSANGKEHTHKLKTGDLFGEVDRHIHLPKDVAFTAVGHCLICCIPRHVFQSFMNAYGAFEQWVRTHNEQMQETLGDWGGAD
ncbi:MAG TPA: cyclic nucleotide-binding domain-containing protein [Mariprofundaceae bacterium]|nr:cyclic nucleotide-binding domain-containing protein [Mariprofundaceae bacterium]